MVRKTIKRLFTFLCCVVLSFIVGYWFFKYQIEDKDVAVVDYLSLEEVTDVEFPVPTICFRNPFVEKKLKENNSEINSEAYLDYLRGKGLGIPSADIDYGKVSLNLSDYFMKATEVWLNDSDTDLKSSLAFQHNHIFSGFDTKGQFMKCFTVLTDLISNRYIQRLHLDYNMSDLLNDWNSSSEWNFEVEFKIHYPGQFFLGEDPDYGEDGGYMLDEYSAYEFNIKELEIIKRRSKKGKQCSKEPFTYDLTILNHYMESQGCRYPYLGWNFSLPLCNLSDKTPISRMTYGRAKALSSSKTSPCLKPCHRISKIRYEFARYRWSTFNIFMKYPEEIKVITQSKEVDIHSLIGNIGGYIGLFLGKFPNIFMIICLYYNTN